MTGQEIFAAINATLNAITTVLLLAAYWMIKVRRIRAHATLMIIALSTSTIFLSTYVTSKMLYPDRTSGLSPSPLRTFYYLLLISHVLLAIGMLPPIFLTVWRAYRRQWDLHRKIAKPTFWVWLYVSITGVIVYWMLYHLFPSMA